MFIDPGVLRLLRQVSDMTKVARDAQRMLEPAMRMHRQFAPVLRMVAASSRAARERQRQKSRPRGCDRRHRPRARRTAASSSTSGADPGGDEPGEPPPPASPRLTLAPPPKAILTFGFAAEVDR